MSSLFSQLKGIFRQIFVGEMLIRNQTPKSISTLVVLDVTIKYQITKKVYNIASKIRERERETERREYIVYEMSLYSEQNGFLYCTFYID